jgi:23S rRNA pseudouridine1911/1915/1917 synthase
VGASGRWGIVHRLDKGTSGLLVVAKTHEAYDGLAELIRRRRVQRRYLALIQEAMSIETGTVDAPIERDPARPIRRRVSPSGRPARTHYEQVAEWSGHGLLEVRLETGRTHQIRVHLSAIGHPVVGDRTYGAAGKDPADPGRPWLHAWRLGFDHPITGEQIVCEAPLPEDLLAALEVLGEPVRGSVPSRRGS